MGQQRARVSCREGSRLHRLAHAVGQGEQSERIGDMAARLAHRAAQILLRHVELVDQAAVGVRLLHGIEILALEVFHEPGGGGLAVV